MSAVCLCAFAQENNARGDPPPPSETTESGATTTVLDAVEITGTHLKRVDTEDTQPITIITHEQIEASGRVSVADFLQQLPENSFGSTNLHSGFDSPTLNLRGIGAQYTLILINGTPLVPEPHLFGGDQQNTSLIPLAAVDHIEILHEGASAIYGSRAIGGVVNIIMRRDYEGGTVAAQTENPQHDGLDTDYASATYGTTNARGGFLISLETFYQQAMLYASRPFLPLDLELNGNPGSYRPRDPATGDLVPGGWYPDQRCPTSLGGSLFPNSVLDSNGFCDYNAGAIEDLAPTFHRNTLFASGHYRLTDSLAFHGLLLVGQNRTHNQSAADNGLIIDAITADSPFNPAPGYPLDLRFRTTDLSRIDDHDDRYGQLTSGFTGSNLFGWNASWTMDLTLSGYLQNDVGQGYVRASALRNAISEGRFNPFGSPQDYTDLDYSPYSDNALHSQDIVAYVQPNGWALRTLPVDALAGVEAGHERYGVSNDLPSTQGDVLNVSASDSAAQRDSYAVFTELDVNSGGTFEAKAADRYDHFSDQGGGSSPKLAALWRFHPDWLLRASVGSGFHVADLESLNQSQSLSTAIGIGDTLRCNTTGYCFPGPYDQLTLANPYLRPETARQANLGFVFSPIPSFSASIDYYDLHLKHGILLLSADAVVDYEANCVLTGASCSVYHEGTVVRDANGQIQTIVVTSVNANVIRTKGLNLQLDVNRQFAIGQLSLGVNLAGILDYEVTLEDLPSSGNQVGYLGQPRYRIAATLGWKRAPWQADLTGHYIAGQIGCLFGDSNPSGDCSYPNISQYATADLQLGRTTSWRGKVTLGIRNLTDRKPPIDLVNATYDGDLYDVVGRTYYVRYEQSF